MLVERTAEVASIVIEPDDEKTEDRIACDQLLALLKRHHPEYDPDIKAAPEPELELETELEPEPVVAVVDVGDSDEVPPAVPSVRDIQTIVCWYFGFQLTEFLSHRRTGKLNYPRQIAMWLAKTLTMKTMPQLGRAFDGRDHTTILHGVRKIENMRQTDEHTRALLAFLMGVIKPS